MCIGNLPLLEKMSALVQTNELTPEELSRQFAGLSAGERLTRLGELYPDRLVASTSFGLQAVVMLHLLKTHLPQVPVIFVDTGYAFPETYRYAEQLIAEYDLNVRFYTPAMTAARQEALYGKLWEQDEEGLQHYALLNKVEPMNRALQEVGGDVWISGLRRVQSSTRSERPFLEEQKETIKAYPILDWSDAQVSAYFYENNLPRHPLEAQGYVTMGDWHSTRPAGEGESGEETRFGGSKYECGLHESSGMQDFQI